MMQIDVFDESLAQRHIVPYDPLYAQVFAGARAHVAAHVPEVELLHIGSTAIADLRGKPMIDMAALTAHDDLRAVQRGFERAGFHRRPVWVDRDDKPYVCASAWHAGRRFNLNVHICHPGDPVHVESLSFLRILAQRPDLRRQYEAAKDRAHAVDPANPEVYNREKEAVIQAIAAQSGPGP